MNKLLHSSFCRFLMVGVGNTLLSMVITFCLYDLAGVPPVISSAIAYIAGAVMSFFLNRRFTFRSQAPFWPSALRFALNVAILWGITTPLLQPWLAKQLQSVFVEKWANNVALVVCMALYTVLNYLGQRFFAFRKRNGDELPEEAQEDKDRRA